MAWFFKHCYWTDPEAWGVVALPKGQSASKALTGHERGDRVLLALTRDSESILSGKICWVCTLHHRPWQTAQIINPSVPTAVHQRWPEAIAIDELWKVEPLEYGPIASGELANEARRQRGKLFKIQNGENELESWLRTAKLDSMEVARSPAMLSFLERSKRARDGAYAA